jgi:hypothetical protein
MSRILDVRPYKDLIDGLDNKQIICNLLADTVQRCIEIIDHKMPGEWQEIDYGRQVAEGAVIAFRKMQGPPSSTAHWWGYKGPNLFCITFGGLLYDFSKSWLNELELDKAKRWLCEALAVEKTAYDEDYMDAVIKDQLDWLKKTVEENN